MKFNVIGNLEHDQKQYADGDTVDLTAEQAAPLIEVGVLEDPKAEKVEKKAPKAEKVETDEVVVGGEKKESGEPSIDTKPAKGKKGKTKDVTPEVGDGL